MEQGRLRIVSAGVYQGLDYLGARSDADYDLDFLRLRLSGLQSDRLLDNWQGVVSGALYWSDDRLPDSERAGFGGQNFGRGYPRHPQHPNQGERRVAGEAQAGAPRQALWAQAVIALALVLLGMQEADGFCLEEASDVELLQALAAKVGIEALMFASSSHPACGAGLGIVDHAATPVGNLGPVAGAGACAAALRLSIQLRPAISRASPINAPGGRMASRKPW